MRQRHPRLREFVCWSNLLGAQLLVDGRREAFSNSEYFLHGISAAEVVRAAARAERQKLWFT